MKHTPGPWFVDQYEDEESRHVITSKPDHLYVAYTIGGLGKEQEANASLISAAPDLLEACKRLLDAFYEDPLENDTASAVELAYDAIAKATGEEQ